jgi:hypothetical protein
MWRCLARYVVPDVSNESVISIFKGSSADLHCSVANRISAHGDILFEIVSRRIISDPKCREITDVGGSHLTTVSFAQRDGTWDIQHFGVLLKPLLHSILKFSTSASRGILGHLSPRLKTVDMFSFSLCFWIKTKKRPDPPWPQFSHDLCCLKIANKALCDVTAPTNVTFLLYWPIGSFLHVNNKVYHFFTSARTSVIHGPAN